MLVGAGVTVAGVVQQKNQFLNTQIRTEQGALGQANALQSAYGTVQAAFQEPTSAGLSSALNQFWTDWQQVANNPTDVGVRATLATQAQTVTNTFNQLSSALQASQTSVNSQIVSQVSSLNSYAQQVASLNGQIRNLEVQGQTPNDLLDQRDVLLSNISSATNAAVTYQPDGTADVSINGTYLVDSAGAHGVSAVPIPGNTQGFVALQWSETGNPLTPTSGTLAGQLQARDAVIPNYESQLDTLAQGLISQVNAIHSTGMGMDGSSQINGSTAFTGTLSSNGSFSINGVSINVFAGDNLTSIVGRINAAESSTGVAASITNNQLVLAPGGSSPQTVDVTADPDGVMANLGVVGNFFTGDSSSTIGISSRIMSNPENIAASQTGAPGDNGNALAIANLQNSLTMDGNTQSITDFYNNIVTDMGNKTSAANNQQQAQTSLLGQLTTLQQSVSGVSLDEETSNLLQYQKSYEMAARVVGTADQMLDSLLQIQ